VVCDRYLSDSSVAVCVSVGESVWFTSRVAVRKEMGGESGLEGLINGLWTCHAAERKLGVEQASKKREPRDRIAKGVDTSIFQDFDRFRTQEIHRQEVCEFVVSILNTKEKEKGKKPERPSVAVHQ
jgi:hypothetical protein